MMGIVRKLVGMGLTQDEARRVAVEASGRLDELVVQHREATRHIAYWSHEGQRLEAEIDKLEKLLADTPTIAISKGDQHEH